jgi:hypothetical protein
VTAKTGSAPWSNFNRYGWSIFARRQQPKDRVEGGKSPKRGKVTSKIRLEWLICIIESGQKKKRTHLHRKTAGIMISEPAEL